MTTRGIYLELLLTYWKKRQVVDWLRNKKNLRGWKMVTRLLMRLGNRIPGLALDLVFVARKAGEAG
jgi:hypothetical protein